MLLFNYVDLDGCSFTDNAGLCRIPGLPTCGTHLSAGAKVGIGLGACLAFMLIITGSVCWWKRWQNFLRAQLKFIHSNWYILTYVIAGPHILFNYETIFKTIEYAATLKNSVRVSKIFLYCYWSARDAPHAKTRTQSNWCKWLDNAATKTTPGLQLRTGLACLPNRSAADSTWG